MTSILRTDVLSQFTCLGDKCEDTCCQGWSMQVDEATLEKYRKEKPELLGTVEPAQETPWIMRKDPASGFCTQLSGGLCGIHKKYGDGFLGDACYFYPRATRRLGDKVLMTATLSCPEIARLALSGGSPGKLQPEETPRLPHTLKDYLPEGITSDEALAVHRLFLAAAEDETASAERILMRLSHASRSLERIEQKSWPQGLPVYLKLADNLLQPAETNPADPFNLLHALCGLIVATHKKPSARLTQTVSDMEKALGVTLDWQQVQIELSDGSAGNYQRLHTLWQEASPIYAPVLRRWLQMQLSLALYPYAGLGATLSERITIIGVRLATVKLALMCSCGIHGTSLPQDMVIRVVQSLSRFLDHLGDPVFSVQIYTETGWTSESRLRGLLEA